MAKTTKTVRTSSIGPGCGQECRADDQNCPHHVDVLGAWTSLVVSGSTNQRIAAIAGSQRGRISSGQLAAAGITPAQIKVMVRTGALHRRHTGVYAVGHSGPIEFGRETEALLAIGEDALLGFRAAAALWGLLSTRTENASVDVIVAEGRHPRRSGIRVHRTRRLHPTERRVHLRLPVTSPARTLLDIAALVTLDELEHALDTALNRKLVRIPQVVAVLERANGRAGAARLRKLVEARTDKDPSISRSHYERRMRDLIRTARLPEPEMNVPLCGYVADLLWRELRLIVEVDGYDFHRGRAKFEADRQRDATLAAHGWTVIRITARQIDNQPLAVIARLAQALVWAEVRQAA